MSIEVIGSTPLQKGQIKAAIFDFDGTISTLRHNWEGVMRPMMLEMISGTDGPYPPALEAEVDDYIDKSTGIQTVYQMRWLAQQVAEKNPAAAAHDEWWYKDEYNRRLMENVQQRIDAIRSGSAQPKQYLIEGSAAFLQALSERGIHLFAASGTDHGDVVKEAGILGVAHWFEKISGAPERQAACSKEAVIKSLIEEEGFEGGQLLLVGDGKVEIQLAVQHGGYALGIASDEEARHGVNPVKRQRLLEAGASAIIGDFNQLPQLLALLGLADNEGEGRQ